MMRPVLPSGHNGGRESPDAAGGIDDLTVPIGGRHLLWRGERLKTRLLASNLSGAADLVARESAQSRDRRIEQQSQIRSHVAVH